MNSRGANRSLQFTRGTRISICCLGFLQSLPASATDFNCLFPKSPTAALCRQELSPWDLWISAALNLKRNNFAGLLFHSNRIFTALFLLQASINAVGALINQDFFSLFQALPAAGRREGIFPTSILQPQCGWSAADSHWCPKLQWNSRQATEISFPKPAGFVPKDGAGKSQPKALTHLPSSSHSVGHPTGKHKTARKLYL